MSQANQPSTTKIATEFVPDVGGGSTTDAGVILGAAYIAFWLLLFVFIGLTWRRQLALSARLGRIERALSENKR
jgi:hypothetical protein